MSFNSRFPMWCANCQTDVATEISADGQSLECVTCGHEIRRVFAPSLHPETQSARELLERWARENQDSANRTNSPPAVPPVKPLGNELNAAVEPVIPESRGAETQRSPTDEGPGNLPPRRGMPEKPFRPPVRVRIDPAHETFGSKPASQTESNPIVAPAPVPLANNGSATPVAPAVPAPKGNHSKAGDPVAAQSNGHPEQPPAQTGSASAAPLKPRLRVDAAHTENIPSPHVDVRPFAHRPGAKPGRAESLWGQLLAYAGVGAITVGTVFVVWGYFGGIEQYASTGWLVATAGQMMLLLGVVTLISGGMQQTTHEVGARIETLDGRIHRIEQSTHQILKGPYFARRRRKGERRAQQPPAA